MIVATKDLITQDLERKKVEQELIKFFPLRPYSEWIVTVGKKGSHERLLKEFEKQG